MKYHKIIHMLAFTEFQRNTFNYIGEYSRKIEEWLKTNAPDVNFIKRYILVSFVIEYRACKHHGIDFAIDHLSKSEYRKKEHEYLEAICSISTRKARHAFIKDYRKRNRQRKKHLDIYFKFFKEPILSEEEYLRMLSFPPNEELADHFFHYATQEEQQ